jgi:hypothetical protein
MARNVEVAATNARGPTVNDPSLRLGILAGFQVANPGKKIGTEPKTFAKMSPVWPGEKGKSSWGTIKDYSEDKIFRMK